MSGKLSILDRIIFFINRTSYFVFLDHGTDAVVVFRSGSKYLIQGSRTDRDVLILYENSFNCLNFSSVDAHEVSKNDIILIVNNYLKEGKVSVEWEKELPTI